MSQAALFKRKRVETGELRHRIAFEQLLKTQTADGSCAGTWSPATAVGNAGTVWAKITPVNGLEKMFAMRLDADITHKIVTRWIEGADTSMRIIFEGRIFQIHSIFRSHEVREYMDILAVEGVGS